ncbi:MAG: proteasome accessory factor [Patescibacteria group bacterium]|nr:proteasome accessory factor [Patescibacteria group bacterium]
MSSVERYKAVDYQTGTPPRAFGSETEFTDNSNFVELYLAYLDSYHLIPEPTNLMNVIEDSYVVSFNNYANPYDVTTINGGRLYLDSETLEFATPECSSPKELVLHERVGERITYETLARAALRLNEPNLNVFKRSGYANVYSGNKILISEDSVGNHENYTSLNEFSALNFQTYAQIMKTYEDNKNAQHFADFLALRKLIDGVGMVDKAGYSITQRPRAVNYRDFSNMTRHGSKRPFFQHGDRMEVRSGEGNKSDWATEFKFGLTSLVLRLIEHDKFPAELALMDPTGDVITLSRNPHGKVMMESGKLRPGADVLKDIVNAAVDLGLSYPEFPKYEQKAAADFYKFYDDLQRVNLREHDVTALADRIDWAARYAYLVARGATYETATSTNLDAVRDDLKWDQIGERDVARRYFSKFGHTALNVSILGPPQTRAAARIRTAKQLAAKHNIHEIDWSNIISRDNIIYSFNNPLDPNGVTTIDVRTVGHPSDEE